MLSQREHRDRIMRRDLADAQAFRTAEQQRFAAETAERDRQRREQVKVITEAAAEREKRHTEWASRPYTVR